VAISPAVGPQLCHSHHSTLSARHRKPDFDVTVSLISFWAIRL